MYSIGVLGCWVVFWWRGSRRRKKIKEGEEEGREGSAGQWISVGQWIYNPTLEKMSTAAHLISVV